MHPPIAYYVSRNGMQSGPYTAEQLTQFVAEGRFLTSDLAWRAGINGWMPLSNLMASDGFLTHPPEVPLRDSREPRTAKRDGTRGSTKWSVSALLVLGGIAVVVGLGLTQLVVIVGSVVADSRQGLSGAGGAIWAVFGPCLPYALLGCALGAIARRADRTAIPALLLTGVSLCVVTCVVHLCSPMLARMPLKGVAEAPATSALFYFVTGVLGMIIISAQLSDHISERFTIRDQNLVLAAKRGDFGAVQEWLAKGTDINCTMDDGTPLTIASGEGHLEVVQALLERGAKVNATDRRSNTALMKAAWQGRLAVVQLLLARGANVNARTPLGGTALMDAAFGGHLQVVRALLGAGAEIGAKAGNGLTALDMAAQKGHSEVRAVLAQAAQQSSSPRF